MSSADIVIIGGGITGVCLAYRLAQRGVSNVVLVERDTIASGSIGRATGGIRQQFADARDIRFSQEGVRFYTQFVAQYSDASISNVPLDYRPPRFYQHGYLFLATSPQRWQLLQSYVALQQSLGVPTQVLDAQEIKRRVPQLIVDDVIGATLCLSDGYTDPPMMTRAIAYAAQQLGVSIYEQTPVVDIIVENERVEGVRTSRDIIDTHLVVNATGAYAAFIGRLAGLTDIPVRPLRRQLLLTRPFDDLPEDVPMVVELETGFHFRRRDQGVLFALPLPPTPDEELCNQFLVPQAFDLTEDENFWSLLQPYIERRCPTLASAQVARTWCGLYEMTPDEQPILGKTSVDGFLCGCGFSGHGFMHAPMATKLLTELIVDGASTTFPIEQFALERFGTGRLLETTRLL